MPRAIAALLALVALAPAAAFADPVDADASVHPAHHHHHKHHRHHHHHHHHHSPADKSTDEKVRAPVAAQQVAAAADSEHSGKTARRTATKAKVPIAAPAVAKANKQVTDNAIMSRMRKLEGELEKKEKKQAKEDKVARRSMRVNGPLPLDFNKRFASAIGQATHSDPAKVKVVGALPAEAGVVQVLFEAPVKVADEATDEASDPDSALANGPMQSFLVAKSEPVEEESETETKVEESTEAPRIDVNEAMPYGDLEPFGREDTAQELTEQSITESNEMVDQLERAEVAEEKRAVFRALTRLRGAAITSFDGIARSQTGNIDEYNKVNKWRTAHPLHHLADEEADVSRWAFPSNADF